MSESPVIGNPIRQQFYAMTELHRDLSVETVSISFATDQPMIYNYALLSELSFREATLAMYFDDADFTRVYPCSKDEVWENITDEIFNARENFQPVLSNVRRRMGLISRICEEHDWWDTQWGSVLNPIQDLKTEQSPPRERTYDSKIPAGKRLD